MISQLSSRQLIKGILGKYGVEVAEVWRDMLFMICGLRVLSETLHKPLGNCSSHTDVFRLGKESGYPDSVALFEQLVWKVSFWIRRQLRHQFVFLISIFYKGWEESSPAGIYPFDVFPFGIPLHPVVGLATYAAVQKAPSHLDGPGAEVDLWVMLVHQVNPSIMLCLLRQVTASRIHSECQL